MPAAGTNKAQRKNTRKPKFQADLAPVEDRIVRSLKEELQLSSNSDFMADAIALFRWAVAERKRGHKIISESTTGEREVLVLIILWPRFRSATAHRNSTIASAIKSELLLNCNSSFRERTIRSSTGARSA